MNEVASDRAANTDMAKVIYILYLVGLVVGITAIIGLVMAYIHKEGAPEWLRTHYELQIRTFWMGLLYVIIAGALTVVLIGFLLLCLVAVWWIVRCAKGLKQLEQREAYPDHLGWMF